MEKLITLKLTPRQLWYLQQQYEAAFTDPDSKNQIEREVSEILDAASIKANRKSKDSD